MKLQEGLIWISMMLVLLTGPVMAETWIKADDNPCWLAANGRCSTTVRWQTDPDLTGRVAIRIGNHNYGPTTWLPCEARGGPFSAQYNFVKETGKTLELFLIDASDCGDDTVFDGMEPVATLAVMGTSRHITATPEHCVDRDDDSDQKCDSLIRWSLALHSPTSSYPVVQLRVKSADDEAGVGVVRACFDPALDPEGDWQYGHATFAGKRLSLHEAACCLAGDPCHDDIVTEPLDSVRVRSIPEVKGAWFFPNLVTGDTDPPPFDPTAPFTMEGQLHVGETTWRQQVMSADPVEQQRIDAQIDAEMAAVAAAGANFIWFEVRDMPWPDTAGGQDVDDPSFEAALAPVIAGLAYLLERAATHDLMVAFNIHHYCAVPTSQISVCASPCPSGGCEPGCIAAEDLVACPDNNVQVAVDWIGKIGETLQDETVLSKAALRQLAYMVPVGKIDLNDRGGDPNQLYTPDNQYYDEVRAFVRQFYPAAQAETELPIGVSFTLLPYRAVEFDRYASARGLFGAMPAFAVDFVHMTSRFEDRTQHHGNLVTLVPELVLPSVGPDHAARLVLADMKVRLMLSADEDANLTAEQKRDLVASRVPCNFAYHFSKVDTLGLAGTWFLQYRDDIRNVINPGGTFVEHLGLRGRSCTVTAGVYTCDYNDPLDWLLDDDFQAPICLE